MGESALFPAPLISFFTHCKNPREPPPDLLISLFVFFDNEAKRQGGLQWGGQILS